MRHTFATSYLIAGGDVFTLQQILGHTTLEMTRRYAALASSHVSIQHRRYSPMDRLGANVLRTGKRANMASVRNPALLDGNGRNHVLGTNAFNGRDARRR